MKLSKFVLDFTEQRNDLLKLNFIQNSHWSSVTLYILKLSYIDNSVQIIYHTSNHFEVLYCPQIFNYTLYSYVFTLSLPNNPEALLYSSS